jgi:membrane fusion protein (multidrug efflux system)
MKGMARRLQHAAAPGDASGPHDDTGETRRGEETGERDGDRAAPRRRGPRSRWLLIAAASIVGLSLAVAYGPRALYLWRHESTDDAYVVGNTIVAIVPQVSGRVVSLRVHSDQQVEAGDLLLQIDPSDYRVAVDRAAANVARWEASLASARQELERGRA